MKKNLLLSFMTIFVIVAGLTTGLLIFNANCDPGQEIHLMAQQTEPEATETADTAVSATEPAAETTVETTEPPITGELFLTVSEITFSVVGESENIYAGTVPVERITWTSGDENIIQVVGGVLTAVAPGATTITASCEGQELSCTAGCLAASEEELRKLPLSQQRLAKRIGPALDNEVLSLFDDAVLIGDNITYGFYNYRKYYGRLENMKCIYRGSASIRGLLKHKREFSYKGKETPLEDALADLGCSKALFLLGTNDLPARPVEDVLKDLNKMINAVLEKNPELEIYLISLLPAANRKPFDNAVNDKISAYNIQLQRYAQENGFEYIPVAPYLQDHVPGCAIQYAQDRYQPSAKGVSAWIDAMRTYAAMEQLKQE